MKKVAVEYVYCTLPGEIREDTAVIHMVLKQLWEKAENVHDDEVNYEHISPNGSYDVIVQTAEEHFNRYLSCMKTNRLNKFAEEYLQNKINNVA